MLGFRARLRVDDEDFKLADPMVRVEVVPADYLGQFFELFAYSGCFHNGSAAILSVFLAI